MSEKNHVQVALMNRRVTPKIEKDAFSYRPQNGWGWVQRVCFWILRKLRCYHWTEHVTIVRTYQSYDKPFIKLLMEQEINLMKNFTLERPRFLLIGVEDYARVMQQESYGSLIQPFNFDQEYTLAHHAGEEYLDGLPKPTMIICNLKVFVLPYMKGILVIP